MSAPYLNPPRDQTATGLKMFDITPSDTTDLPDVARSIRQKNNGTAGAIVFQGIDGVQHTTDILPGQILPVLVYRVLATGTTATGLEGIV